MGKLSLEVGEKKVMNESENQDEVRFLSYPFIVYFNICSHVRLESWEV